ncbi:hypothetical protein O181_037971 [Austropuccinia psidii MF-1]|uniref:Integrase catalytic domain-containing protein n=1 Tax=Austropuccinia psidii MF-1 TaxID=1389203 RepID=A0A9Q3D767_9BASI|nr:hypothetical protein [Austropuccinia psidii MF-1]
MFLLLTSKLGRLSISRSAQKQKVHTDIPKKEPLGLLVSDVLGPFEYKVQVFWYLLTLRDHVSTYSIIYPLKSRLDAPAAILDEIKQLQVCTGLTPKALRTDNAREFTSTSFANSLVALGITFCPSLPYLPQENGKAEGLHRTLGDMARAMVIQSQMPSRFWQFAYTSSSYIHNRIPNSHCPKTSPHQELFGHAPSIATLYPHGADAVVHIPSVQKRGKLEPRAIDCKLLRPLLSGSWLLWDQFTNKMIQSASVILTQFQLSRYADTHAKGSLLHIMNVMSLGEVPTERYFEEENWAIASLPLVKDVKIPNHLGQALSGPNRDHWRTACLAELDQMVKRDVWSVVAKEPGMKTIGHRVLNVAMSSAGDCCAELLASGAYLYSLVEECILMKPPTYFMPELRGKVLSLKKALYGMQQGGRCWWKFLSGILQQLGFVATEVDQSLYIFRGTNAVIAIWIHVDNGVITSASAEAISNLKTALVSQLEIKWSDKLDQIVGLECSFGDGEVAIAQWQLTDSILEAYPRQIVARD